MIDSDDGFDIIIEPNRSAGHYWKDLWKFRGLFYFLSWRDLLVRYKQTAIGIAWSVIRPLITLVVFTIVFGKIAKLDNQGVPYALLVCAAMIPWQFFANSFTEASNSLTLNSNLLTKVYFPRLIIPASTIIVSLVDFLISLGILFGVMIYYHFIPGWQLIMLPAFLLLAVITSLGSGVLIASLNVKYRDFRYVVPFIVQLGLYISPVGWSSSIIPDKYRLLYSLNPMAGVIDGFRWCILGGDAKIYIPGFILSIAISFLLMITGIRYFRKMEKSFVDII